MKENRENHGLKTMGPKPWIQKDEPKTRKRKSPTENHGTKTMG